MKDIIIIGAGVVGTAIARELSKYKVEVAVLEKDYDIANGTSKANSGIVHPGEDPIPGTMKAKMNIRGNEMFEALQEELDFPFRRNGSMVLCLDEKDLPQLEELRQRGIANGMASETMTVLNREEALAMESNLSEQVVGALYLQTGGIVGPYELTIALAENAAENGVRFYLDTRVGHVTKVEDHFEIETNKGRFTSRLLINAAGVYADEINNMLSQVKYHIIPRSGEYILLDKVAKQVSDKTLFQLPSAMGKGILVTPTTHGNIILGPTAEDKTNKDEVATTKEKLDIIIEKAKLSVGQLPLGQTITGFVGLRAHEEGNDFVIGEAEDVPGLINALGIESPGLTSAPAIAEYIRTLVVEKLEAEVKTDFNPKRENVAKFAHASFEEKQRLIEEDAKYGNVICRCETVTEAEVRAALRRPVGATTVDGVKRRTRAGMGRCQGGFCVNRIVEILAEELGISMEEVRKSGKDSELLVSDLKADLRTGLKTNLEIKEGK